MAAKETRRSEATTARSRRVVSAMPPASSLQKCLDVVRGHREGLIYFKQAVEARLDTPSLREEYSGLVNETDQFIQYVSDFEKKQAMSWAGKRPPGISETDFIRFQNYLATASAEQLQHLLITLDCAISDASEYIRAFSSDEQVIEGAELEDLDTQFNVMLAEKNMLSQGGVIYQATADGEIKLDAKNNPQKASPAVVREMLSGSDFERSLQKVKPDVKIEIRLHDYPTPTLDAEAYQEPE